MNFNTRIKRFLLQRTVRKDKIPLTLWHALTVIGWANFKSKKDSAC